MRKSPSAQGCYGSTGSFLSSSGEVPSIFVQNGTAYCNRPARGHHPNRESPFFWNPEGWPPDNIAASD